MTDVMLGSLELFCLCAEEGSLAAAANKAGLGAPAVSRSLARLEQRLGVKLIERSTRRMQLTGPGQRYYQQCRQALDVLYSAERDAAGAQQVASGRVRISLPTPFAERHVLALLPRFRESYPQVELEVHLSNRNIDFVADGFDLAIRMRNPPVSELIARHLGNASLLVVAAPTYLQRRGLPAHPDELGLHDCIQFVLPSSGQPIAWQFLYDGAPLDIETGGGISVAEDLLGCITLAAHGGGLLQTYRFAVADRLRDGSLVEVLADYSGRVRPVSLMYRKSAHTPLRVRVLIDFLMQNLRGVLD
tara:strand:+ start:774 stop:1682 length:909 start_codon:yes stop_codon:yes gene_type:complete